MASTKMMIKALTLILAFVVLTGCAAKPYDYSALKAANPRSILVIPPKNNSVEVNAPYTFLSTISAPLAERGYYVFPVAMVDTFFKENGLPTTAEMNEVPLDKLKEFINPDAILYVDIDQWGQEYQLISSKTVVSSRWRLIDGETGALLWQGSAQAVQSSGDGGGGLAGALIGAVIDQIAGSIVDKTPDLSRQANNLTVYNQHRGLLPGPYRPVEATP